MGKRDLEALSRFAVSTEFQSQDVQVRMQSLIIQVDDAWKNGHEWLLCDVTRFV